VRISALHTISINYLAHQIERIQKEIPELRTRVISDSLSTCCELLLEGAVDIMLVYYHQYVSPKIDDTGFERKDLLSDKLIPVAARDAAQQQGWHLSNRDGAPIPHLAYEQSSFLGQVIENSISIEALNIETIYIDGLVETIRRRLLQGSGFAWMPQTAVETELQNGSLVAIGDQSLNISVTISALANPTYFDDSARKMWSLL
jgi:DNA-binding transcriptional LysR family regulator